MADMLNTHHDDSDQARFWAKVEKSGPNDCWPWTACRTSGGYGSFHKRGTRTMLSAPRVAWEIANGAPWPSGMDACHTCDNRICVNPAHIWPGTRRDNVRDMVVKGRAGGFAAEHLAKTHCRHGHALTGENLWIKIGRGREERVCRTCQRAWTRKWDRANRGAAK